MKIGNAKARLVPLTADPLYHEIIPKHLTFIGTKEVHFHTYDCADFPNNAAPKGIPAGTKLIPDLPTATGQTDRIRTEARLRLVKARTGLSNFTEVAKVLSVLYKDTFVNFPSAKFDPLWNDYEKVEIRFRTRMIPFVVRLVDPNPALPDPDICILSIPSGGYFIARIKGYCSETPKVPPRKIVQCAYNWAEFRSTWYSWATNLAVIMFEETSKNPKSKFYKRSFNGPQHRNRRNTLLRVQRRGLPL